MADCIRAWLASHDTVYLMPIKQRPRFAATRSSRITIDIIEETWVRSAKNLQVLNLCLMQLQVVYFNEFSHAQSAYVHQQITLGAKVVRRGRNLISQMAASRGAEGNATGTKSAFREWFGASTNAGNCADSALWLP
jgi:hypothetical protein